MVCKVSPLQIFFFIFLYWCKKNRLSLVSICYFKIIFFQFLFKICNHDVNAKFTIKIISLSLRTSFYFDLGNMSSNSKYQKHAYIWKDIVWLRYFTTEGNGNILIVINWEWPPSIPLKQILHNGNGNIYLMGMVSHPPIHSLYRSAVQISNIQMLKLPLDCY